MTEPTSEGNVNLNEYVGDPQIFAGAFNADNKLVMESANSQLFGKDAGVSVKEGKITVDDKVAKETYEYKLSVYKTQLNEQKRKLGNLKDEREKAKCIKCISNMENEIKEIEKKLDRINARVIHENENAR